MRRISTVILAAGIALFPAGSAFANPDEPDVAAWVKANKDTIEFALDIDVDSCAGLDGLSYGDAVRLADAQDIDLKALAEKTDPGEMLEYVQNTGLTLADVDAFLTAFCAGEVTPPVPGGTPEPEGTPEAPEGPKNGDEDPRTDDKDCVDFDGPQDVSDGDPNRLDRDGDGIGCEENGDDGSLTEFDPSDGGKMADTGGMSPWMPIGVSSVLLGSGGAILALKRKGII